VTGQLQHSLALPVLLAIFLLALMIFGPFGFGPRGPRPPQ